MSSHEEDNFRNKKASSHDSSLIKQGGSPDFSKYHKKSVDYGTLAEAERRGAGSEMRKQTLRENYLAARESGNADDIFTAASVDLRDQSTDTEEEIPEPKKKSLMSRIGGGIGKFFSGIGQRIGKFFSGGTSPRAEEADSTPQPEIGGWSEDIDYDDLDRQGKNRPEGPAMNPEGHQQLSKLGMSHDMWKNWDPQADDEEKQY